MCILPQLISDTATSIRLNIHIFGKQLKNQKFSIDWFVSFHCYIVNVWLLSPLTSWYGLLVINHCFSFKSYTVQRADNIEITTTKYLLNLGHLVPNFCTLRLGFINTIPYELTVNLRLQQYLPFWHMHSWKAIAKAKKHLPTSVSGHILAFVVAHKLTSENWSHLESLQIN